MTRRRRTREPDKRLDWRDPDMPVLRAMEYPRGVVIEPISPEEEQAWRKSMMMSAMGPNWRNDPTYNLAKRRRRR